MILTRSTRLTQPTGPVELDYTNPLLSGHSFLWSAAHDVRKSLIGSQRLATVVGEYAPSTEGKSWKAASGKPVSFPLGEHFISTSNGVGTGDFTIWVIANPESSATLRDMVGQSFTAGGPSSGFVLIRANATAGSVTFYCGTGTGAGTFDSVAASGQANGRVRLFLARRLGTELSLWVDGAKVASGAYAVRNILAAQTQTAMSVGCNPYSTGATSIHNNIMAGGANRALSDDEIESLSANPWQLFRPVQRRVYFDMGAGGGATGELILAAGNASQLNSGGTGSIELTHELAGSASSQDNAGSGGAMDQALVLVGASSVQANSGSTASLSGVQVSLTGAASAQANAASVGAISQSINLQGGSDIQANTGLVDAIVQAYVLGGASSAQSNLGSTGQIILGDLPVVEEVLGTGRLRVGPADMVLASQRIGTSSLPGTGPRIGTTILSTRRPGRMTI